MDRETQATIGGPGLDGYAFQADVYCVEHGRELIREVLKANPSLTPDDLEWRDTDTLPQPIFFGESDTAQHCTVCHTHLYS